MKLDIINYIQNQLLILTNKKYSKNYILKYLIPVINNIINSKNNKFLISGSQGVGKSTLSQLLKYTIQKFYNKRVMLLSIDDYYLSKKKRIELSKKIHPLLITRGVPGTHNIKKLHEHVIKFNNQQFPIITPVFDKLKDDIIKKRKIVNKAQILILEGWCCGALPIEVNYLKKNLNLLESNLDKNFIWRKFYNSKLGNEYQKVFNLFKKKIYIQPPSFKYIIKWRQAQEMHNISKSPNNKVMNRYQLKKFIEHYEKITKWMIKTMPSKANILIKVDINQKIKKINIINNFY